MKTIEEIRIEIAEIDKALDSVIADYKNGKITEEKLHDDKMRFASARNTLLWVIK